MNVTMYLALLPSLPASPLPLSRARLSNLLSEKDVNPTPDSVRDASRTQSNLKKMNTTHIYNSTLCQDLSEDGNSRMFLAMPLGNAEQNIRDLP